MTVKITLSCDGCHVQDGPHMLPRRQFKSFNGSGHGFGTWTEPGLKDVAFPDGWIVSDPYTGCTYCPPCWAEIIAPQDEEGSSE